MWWEGYFLEPKPQAFYISMQISLYAHSLGNFLVCVHSLKLNSKGWSTSRLFSSLTANRNFMRVNLKSLILLFHKKEYFVNKEQANCIYFEISHFSLMCIWCFLKSLLLSCGLNIINNFNSY